MKKKSLTLVVTTICCLVLAEFVLRWVLPSPFETGVGTTRTGKARLYGWAPLPGYLWTFVDPDTGEVTYYRINSQGWTDVEHQFENPDGVVRILFLGDSYTAGHVPLERCYPRIVEGLLRNNGFPNVEVISMAVGGWGTDQALEALREEGIKYQPDFVVYQFTSNDIFNNLQPGAGLSPEDISNYKPFKYVIVDGTLERITLEQRTEPVSGRVRWQLLRSSLIFYVDKLIDSIRFRIRGVQAFYHPVDPLNTFWRHQSVEQSQRLRLGWELLESLIVEMKHLSENNQSEFLIFPADGEEGHRLWLLKHQLIQSDGLSDYAFSEGRRYPIDLERPLKNLRDISTRLRIPLIEPKRQYDRYDNDYHPNDLGNERMAQDIVDFIVGWEPFLEKTAGGADEGARQ